MKIIAAFFFIILLSTLALKAQTSFSCSYREICYWNDDDQKFDEDCSGYEESSLFVVNKDETMFEHTIESMKSAYYVNSKEYDEKDSVWTYAVTSDVGNHHYYVFDPKNMQVRCGFTQDGRTGEIIFTVKAIF